MIKARIAQEHPLLLFTTLPRSTTTTDSLTVRELFEHGRTAQFNELPELLWAATGIRMGRVEQYLKFGKLRNGVVHFALPTYADWHADTMRFLFEVIEPLVHQFWKESIVVHAKDWDEVILDGYLEDQIQIAGITITPDLRRALDGEEPI